MEKSNTSILKQKMNSLNDEIDKFTLCLKSGISSLSNNIKHKELASAVFNKYIESPYNKAGNKISLQNGFSFSNIIINCDTYPKLKDNKKDIKKIVEDFINNVLNEINNYSKEYTFYLVQHSYFLVRHDKDYTYITINISFTLNLY